MIGGEPDRELDPPAAWPLGDLTTSWPVADPPATARPSRPLVTALALGWLLTLAVVPVVLWHRALGDVLGSFHWSLRYVVSELSPPFMLLAGLAFLVPVALSSGLSPESRLYPRARRAYIGWGTVLYLIGIALTLQMVEVWSYSH